MAFLMETFELLSGLIKFNLGGLGFRYLLFQLLALVSHLNREFLDLKSQLLDLSLVSSTVLFEGQVVFFLLAGSKSPLLQLLLVPVHFKFELVHALVGFEDHILDVVEAVLLVSDALLKLFDLVLKSARLAFGNLLHVFFSFDFLVLGIYETLGVDELHLDGL